MSFSAFMMSRRQEVFIVSLDGRRNISGRPGGCRTNNLTNKNFYARIISTFVNLKRTRSFVLSRRPLSFSVLYRLLIFYRAMHFSAKRDIAIACRLSLRLSVCLSVTLVNCDHIG